MRLAAGISDRSRRTGAALALAAGLLTSAGCDRGEAGRRMFLGEIPLPARLAGDPALLPDAATRCANCHLAAPTGGAAGTRDFAPALTAATLRGTRPRRGGPPSRYDVERFCTLLRTGIDPAHVVIKRAMPRYAIDDRQCRALWVYLTETEQT